MSISRRLRSGALAGALAAMLVPGSAAGAIAPSAGRAADSLKASFPELADAPQAPGVPAGSRVDAYVGSDIARVTDARGRRNVLLSSMPLRSRVGDDTLQPLSLELRNAGPGEVRPQNPVAEVRIATDPRRGFTIGPDPQRLVTIVPLDVDDAAPGAARFAGQLLFAGIHAAADLLVRPSAVGVQTFEQLTGADAPESFAYRLVLGPGQRAELANGIVTIRQAGEVIVQSTPPIALDADHRSVPVTTTLEGDVLRLGVPHRGRGLRYPIAVDPDWTSSYDYYDRPGLGLQGWHVAGQAPGGEGPENYYDAFINTVWDPAVDPQRKALGFFIRPRVTGASRVFPTGVGAQLFFNAPGTTSIRSVSYEHVHRFNDRDRQTLRLGLYGGSYGEADDVFEAEQLSEDSVTLPRDPFADDEDTPAKSAVMWMFSSPCVAGTDMNCPPTIPSATRTLLRVGSVQLVLTDFDFPTTEAPGTLRDLQDRWTNTTGSRDLNPSATDEGSGVRDLTVTAEDDGGTHLVRAIQAPCRPDHDQTNPPQDNAICPRVLTLDPLILDTSLLPDGRSVFTVDAADLAANTAADGGSATAFAIYLDRKPPASTAAGELYAAGGGWYRPQRPGTLTVTGTDTAGGQGKNSGIAFNRLRATDQAGAQVLSRDADTCTPPGPIAAPCDPGKSSTFTVDPRQLPEGEVNFSAGSSDLAANDSDPVTWTVGLDRTAPAARATGDLLGLTSQHTNSTTPTSVTLHGRDAASGVARLQLVASNSDGEKVLADRDTCTAADLDPGDGSCPHTPAVTVAIDPAELPDGPTTFIARAIDHAGITSADDQDWDTYVDHTPPDPPDNITVTQTSNTTVQITWPAVVDQPLGSGNVSYEYLVTAGGQPIGTWRATNNPYAQAGGLPPGTTIKILVRAVDAAHNVGKPAGGGVTLRAAVGYSPERIYVNEGLDQLERYANTAGLRLAGQGGAATALRTALRRLGSFVSKAGGIFTFIASFLTSEGDLSCEQGPIMRQAKVAFTNAGRVLQAAGSARVGRHPTITSNVVGALASLQGLEAEAERLLDVLKDKQCEAPSKVALGVIGKTTPALNNALGHLASLQAQLVARGRSVGREHCSDARELVKRLGPGRGRPNYVVYWSPPPPPAARVQYVGISRALDSRCQAHPAARSRSLETLNLPPLFRAEATSVEEALISHFGTRFELPTPGQLDNVIHAISSLRPDYCARLLLGQAILALNGYRSPYATAHFTRAARCPPFV